METNIDYEGFLEFKKSNFFRKNFIFLKWVDLCSKICRKNPKKLSKLMLEKAYHV